MLTDWELWAVAEQIAGEYGPQTPLFVATRIGALAASGDVEGVTVWKEVARRITILSAAQQGERQS